MFSLNTSGFDKLQDSLVKYGASVTNEVKEIIANSANNIAETAKANTSEKIADTITTEISDDGLTAVISANSEQAAATEYGTVTPKEKHPAPAKPFLNPAFEENRQKIIDSIAQTLQQ